MKVDGLTFHEAVNVIVNGTLPGGIRSDRPPPVVARPIDPRPAKPTGMPHDDAVALVADAEARLWSSDGADAVAYLTGPERCLTPESIRSARLGWTSHASGVAWNPPGTVIPWFVGERLAMVKIRPDPSFRERFPKEGGPPKYLEAYRDPSILRCYPGAATIRPGRPLLVTEGEFDALLLTQELGASASVITLGSASSRPERPVLDLGLMAPTWFIATDADTAGDKAFTSWPARARRVRPPGSFKDWTEAKAGGINLARWWRDRLDGIECPDLLTWDELSAIQWGQAIGDETPGIDRP
jgi:DNA primase